MIDPKEIKAGSVYLWLDQSDDYELEITIVGFDPYTNQWVAACEDWAMGISHLDEDDFRLMRRI